MAISTSDISTWEEKGIEFLFNLSHAQNNLFFAKLEGLSDAQYRISKISVSTPSLDFERNGNRFLALKNATLPEEVTLSWIEDSYHSVENFHTRWMRNWYDFTADFIPIGSTGKFKNIVIVAYHYQNVNNSLSAPITSPDPVMYINLVNCVPTNAGASYDFGWDNGGIKEFQTTYKFSKIYVQYATEDSQKKSFIPDIHKADSSTLKTLSSETTLGGLYSPPSSTQRSEDWNKGVSYEITPNTKRNDSNKEVSVADPNDKDKAAIEDKNSSSGSANTSK